MCILSCSTNGITKISCGVLFGIAIIAASSRTLIRLQTQSHLAPDDIFLLLACINLVVCTALFYVLAPGLFVIADLEYDMPRTEPLQPIVKMLYIWMTLTWLTLYSVKLCFLFLFKKLVGVFSPMVIYWRFVVGWTAVCFGISSLIWFVNCRSTGQEFRECIDTSFEISRGKTSIDRSNVCRDSVDALWTSLSFAFTVASISLDMVTDMLSTYDPLHPSIDRQTNSSPQVLSIPVFLLWNMRVPLRQKLGIGIFFSFNVVMLSIAVVRACGLRNANGSIDVLWQCFWQQIEITLAVVMASLTAFRAIFTSNTTSSRRPRSLFWYGKPTPTGVKDTESQGK